MAPTARIDSGQISRSSKTYGLRLSRETMKPATAGEELRRGGDDDVGTSQEGCRQRGACQSSGSNRRTPQEADIGGDVAPTPHDFNAVQCLAMEEAIAITAEQPARWKFGAQVTTVTRWPTFTHSRACS